MEIDKFAIENKKKSMTDDILQIAIIGGGAAGFFAAIEAKRRHPDARVTIFEKGSRVLAKVEITGGGRCNLTNSFSQVSDLKQVYPRGHKLMKRLFRQFDYRSAMEWFESRGVRLVTQTDECVFPESQDSRSIVDCLVSCARRAGVETLCGHRLTAIAECPDGRLCLSFANGSRHTFHRVAIATGGSPRMQGFSHLSDLGHSVEPPVPSLFTLNIADKSFNQLMGTVVDPVQTSIPGTRHKACGPLLVTHWGMSGPAVLKLSSHAAKLLHERDYATDIAVNWINETNRSVVEELLQGIISDNPQKKMSSVRPCSLPSRLWLYLLGRSGLSAEKRWAELGKKGRNALIETLTNDVYRVSGRGVFKEEFVTCGGVSLGDVNPHTLESRVCPNLFFAGEVLDIDAVTGGFNLQAAWTTGFVVGSNI